MPRVLIIEDDRVLAATLGRALRDETYDGVEDYVVETVFDAQEGLKLGHERNYDVVITDLHFQGPGTQDVTEGLKVITELHAAKPQLPIVLMTGDKDAQRAIEAIKLGAHEYLFKTGDPEFIEHFLGVINRAVASHRLVSEPVDLGTPASPARHAIIGSSRAMSHVYMEIGRVATKPVTVLIQGETGTGKELVARALHQHSDRKEQPFIAVNCVAIPETLLESELFGHERGAFTGADVRRIGRFEQANGGTIFLDEIGDMTLSTQAKLLRVLQEKTIQRLGGSELIPVDIRVLAATHRNLEQSIRDHKFREDLYYRLNVAAIHLPPLRERTDDIPALVDHFIQRFCTEFGMTRCAIAPDAMQFLREQHWPGNVRELENAVCKVLLLARGHVITRDVLRVALGKASPVPPPVNQPFTAYVSDLLRKASRGEIQNAEAALDWDVGYELYKQAIELARGNQAKAAKWLGVSRPTMREKLRSYGLHSPRATPPQAS